MRTRVLLTIDTEFTIGGAFSNPKTHSPIGVQNVLCSVGGKSEGLEFLLDTLGESGLVATFFIEALQCALFGDEPMGDIARQIVCAGHDAQLHLHPVWTYFDASDWKIRLQYEKPCDDLYGRTHAELVEWMNRGIETFQRWGIARPVALRTGNLMVDASVYRAMEQVGFKVSSNIGLGVFRPLEPGLQLAGGVHQMGQISEVPVFTYEDISLGGSPRLKCLTITGSSFEECRYLLDQAHESGTHSVVILTHCHEFVRGEIRSSLQANRMNQRRLRMLCRYLESSKDRFETAPIASFASGGSIISEADANIIKIPFRLALPRMLANWLNDYGLLG